MPEPYQVYNTEEMEDYNILTYTTIPFEDRVLYRRMPLNVTETVWKEFGGMFDNETDVRKHLAGDLDEEWKVHLDESSMRQEIKQFFCDSFSHIFRSKVIGFEFQRFITNRPFVWINRMKANEYNPIHRHSGLFSFVWYLDIPEEIREEHKHQNSNGYNRGLITFVNKPTNNIYCNPRTSDVFIFASNHLHQVFPFKSDVERISLAGNIDKVKFEDGSVMEAKNDT